MTKKTVVYDDFSQGDYSRVAPAFNTRGGLIGNNVVPYPGGSVGVRERLFNYTIASGPSKTILLSRFVESASQIAIMCTDKTLYRISDYPTPSSTSTTPSASQITTGGVTFAGTIADMLPFKDQLVVVQSAGTGGYVVTDVGANPMFTVPIIVAVPGMPNGYTVKLFGDQFVIAGPLLYPNRLYYSALGDPQTWTGDFVDVGYGSFISKIEVQRNALIVFKGNGDIFSITGVMGDGEIIRRMSTGSKLPAGFNVLTREMALSGNDNIWWYRTRDAWMFTGSQTFREPLPKVSGLNQYDSSLYPAAIVSTGSEDNVVMFEKTNAYMRKNGSWTRHQLPITVSAVTDISAVSVGDGGIVIFTSTGAASPTMNLWRTDAIEPSSGNDGASGAVLAASLALPEYWPESGDRCVAHKVIVDFSYLPAGGSFSLTADALNQPGIDGVTSSTTATWSDTGAGSAMIRTRATFAFGDQGEGGGTVLRFTALTGVVIHRVVMEVDEISQGDF